jgi:surfeit locus 1 family protein
VSYTKRLLPTLAAVLAVALTVSLGNWQMRRAAEKSEAHRQQESALAETPTRLTASPLADREAAALAGRRLVVRGELLPQYSVYVDNRTHEGIAGFHLVTPLRIEPRDGKEGPGSNAEPLHVLVLRGWLPRDPRERTRLPVPPSPQAPVELVGLAELELPQTLELKQVGAPGRDQRIWQNLTRERFLGWSGLRLQPLVIRQTEAMQLVAAPGEGAAGAIAGSPAVLDDGVVREWHRPGPDVAKHHGYAFQWYALAAAVVVLWVWFLVVVPARARRASRGEAK